MEIASKKEDSIDLNRRIVSGLIDAGLYVALSEFLSFIFTGKTDNLPDYMAWGLICIYVVVFHGYLKWTPGMRAMAYRFSNSDDQTTLSSQRLIFRWFCVTILRFTIIPGIIAMMTYNTKTGFYWDKWFKMKVVNLKK